MYGKKLGIPCKYIQYIYFPRVPTELINLQLINTKFGVSESQTLVVFESIRDVELPEEIKEEMFHKTISKDANITPYSDLDKEKQKSYWNHFGYTIIRSDREIAELMIQ